MKKKQTVVALAVASILAVGAIGSYSYFSDRGIMVNDLTTGNLDLIESETLWDNTTDGKNMYPGYTVKKNPTIKNITGIVDNGAYIKAVIRLKNPDGSLITDRDRCDLIYNTIRYDENDIMREGRKYSNGDIHLYPNVNPEFMYIDPESSIGEYVYYMRNPLASADTKEGGEEITLFNTVVYPTEWSQTELNAIGDYKIEIEFTGIQEKAFEDLDEAMEAMKHEAIHLNYERPAIIPGKDTMD